MAISKKPLLWRGSSHKDIKDDKVFTPKARSLAGHELNKAQSGLDPEKWKPF